MLTFVAVCFAAIASHITEAMPHGFHSSYVPWWSQWFIWVGIGFGLPVTILFCWFFYIILKGYVKRQREEIPTPPQENGTEDKTLSNKLNKPYQLPTYDEACKNES